MNRATRTAELAKATQNDPRWALIVARDALVDRTFYYSVKTTGVYCGPSCAARLARPENVQFHGTCEEAEKAGFRPCKRCKPTEPSLAKRHAAKIAKVCRMIETSEESPSLNKLAEYAGMSVFHLHRTFKAVIGLTPNGYAAAHRAHRVRAKLGKKSVGNRCDLRRRVQFKQLFLRDIQCGIRYNPIELPRRRR